MLQDLTATTAATTRRDTQTQTWQVTQSCGFLHRNKSVSCCFEMAHDDDFSFLFSIMKKRTRKRKQTTKIMALFFEPLHTHTHTQTHSWKRHWTLRHEHTLTQSTRGFQRSTPISLSRSLWLSVCLVVFSLVVRLRDAFTWLNQLTREIRRRKANGFFQNKRKSAAKNRTVSQTGFFYSLPSSLAVKSETGGSSEDDQKEIDDDASCKRENGVPERGGDKWLSGPELIQKQLLLPADGKLPSI